MSEHRRKENPQSGLKTYNFSSPIFYYISKFGKESEKIITFNLNVNVQDLKDNFVLFEDMPNVEYWSIKDLVQRELDNQRAQHMCNDYLMSDQVSFKYFPGLIAVLLPTDDKHMPMERFSEVDSSEVDNVNRQIVKARDDLFNETDKAIGLAGGINQIIFDKDSGFLVWNKLKVSAVIIDGQHRFKSLLDAVERDKTFAECEVSISLIDLTGICNAAKLPPTEAARNLFVTVNNTPEDISEARIVLMDDRDVLNTFTQILVDDSDKTVKPAVPVELIDWRCEGRKYDAEEALTGVLPLRQIIQAAIFDGISLSSITDREDPKRVSKWIAKIKDYLDPDPTIESILGPEQTLKNRFINLGGSQDSEEDDGEFLYSYSARVSRILADRFKSLYLNVFRETFANLEPYKQIVEIADSHGVFKKDSELRRYFRSFGDKRERYYESLKQPINAYRKDIAAITKGSAIKDDSILHTVMGQKALFKAMFRRFLDAVEGTVHSGDVFEKSAKEFIEDFNFAYNKIKDKNIDLFKLSLSLPKTNQKKINESVRSSVVVGNFWSGILLKPNGELDYSPTAVELLSKIIENIVDDEDSDLVFIFPSRTKITKRHRSHLDKLFIDQENENEELAEAIVAQKEEFVAWLLEDKN